MKVRIYTNEEIEKLKSNIFVRDIKYKREINYDPVFKLWCILMRLECPELSAKEIFNRGNFDTTILSDRIPMDRIREWVNNYMKYGVKYFIPEREYYSSIKRYKQKEDKFNLKEELLEYILNRLEKFNND